MSPAIQRRRSFWFEAVVLLVVAVVLAAVSNALAGPERRLRWIGTYDASAGPRAAATTPAAAAAPAAPTPALPGAAAAEASFPSHPDKAWVEISGEDAK